MYSGRVFWSIYALFSVAAAGLSILLFRLFTEWLNSPYEEAVIVAGLLTMPINWLVGEQLTWRHTQIPRSLRAGRYFLVYAVGLSLNAFVIHWLGHMLRFDARISDLFGLFISMAWTGPMNRYYTWAKDVSGKKSCLPAVDDLQR